MKKFILATILLFTQIGFSKILKDDHYSSGYNSYSWNEVCQSLVKRKSPLIEKAGVSKLDCMGRVVSASKFCEKQEAGNAFYTRAVVFDHDETVRCYSGKKVIVKWQCNSMNDFYCKDKEIGCYHFKENLASRLKLVHSSITKSNQKDILNCYFDKGTESLSLNL